jgi:hypothetical protein
MANAYFKTRWTVTEPGVFHVTDYSVNRKGRNLDYFVGNGLLDGSKSVAISPRIQTAS